MPVAINDNTTWRYPAIYVNDGGVWRSIRAISINDNGTWRPAVRYMGRLTVGFNADFGYGLSTLFGYGSVTPATMPPTTTGNEISVVTINYSAAGDHTDIQLRATAPSDITSITQTGYLKYVTVNGLTLSTADADTFINTPSGGTDIAAWEWATDGDTFGLQALNGSTVSVQFTCVA